MKIVVLDGYTLNPGDLSWDTLNALGSCTVHDRTPPEETLARCAGCEAVLTNKVVLSSQHLDALPGLRYIGVLATGTNVVDVPAAAARGVVVTNVPDYSSPSVAQLTIALLLELALQVGSHSAGVRAGRWSRSKDFSYADHPLIELEGRTLGVVGYGAIGRRVADLARAMGMRVLVFTRTPPTGRDASTHPGLGRSSIEFVDLEPLLRQSHAVTLHCPLTPETRGLMTAGRLAQMRSDAVLINTARGPLVDEPALARALNSGRLAGAGLDVLSEEPPKRDHPLLTARNCILTPHIGWATGAARARLLQVAVSNLRAFLNGTPQNVVSTR